ncbi:hypothetical protein [Methylorubrum extorquens]
MKRFLAPLFALIVLTAPALAQTRALPPGEIRANGDITFGNALKLGKRDSGKTIITPDTLQILGPGSTGLADDFSVRTPKFPDGRTLNSWLRTSRSTVLDRGTVNDAATADSTAAVNERLSAMKATGGRLVLPAGKYLSSGWVLDYSGQTADAPDDSRQVSLSGDGAGNTVIYANTPNTYGLKVLGGLTGGANSLVYSGLSDFTIARRTQPRLGSRGLWLAGVAFGRLRDIYLTDLEIPFYMESTLSTALDNLLIASSTYGLEVGKGTGFSNSNNNTFNNPQFRLISKWAVRGGPLTAWTMNGLGIQGVGTMGDADSGGMKVTFDGTEGGNGLAVNGGYVEFNRGDADFFLTNTGTRTVTHVLSNVTFNRISGTQYVRTHFKLVGKHHVICIGCAFGAYNDYVRDVSRPLVDMNPADSTFTCIRCTGLDGPDNTLGITNGPTKTYRGFVSAAGVITQLEGTGLTATKSATGDYIITHNFGGTANWNIQITSNATDTVFAERAVKANNFAEILMRAPGGGLADGAFSYEIQRY